MSLQQRQGQLIQKINQIKDENLLILLEDELSYHLIDKNEIELSEVDLNELIMLADEPENVNIISESEYRKATDKWRL